MLRIALISAAVIAVAVGAPVPEHNDVPGQYASNYNAAVQAADSGAARVRRRLQVFTESEDESANVASPALPATFDFLSEDIVNEQKGITDVNVDLKSPPKTEQSRFAHIATEDSSNNNNNPQSPDGNYESWFKQWFSYKENTLPFVLPNGYTRLSLARPFQKETVYEPLPQLRRLVGKNYASRLLNSSNPMLKTVLKDAKVLFDNRADLFDVTQRSKWRAFMVQEYFRLKEYVDKWEESLGAIGVRVEKGRMWEVVDPWREIDFS